MKILLATALMLLFSGLAISQDIIETHAGQKIEGKVIEITSSSIRYYSKDQPEGPIRNLDLKTVSLITYQDGTKERFVLVGAEADPMVNRPDVVPTPPRVRPERVPNNKDRILQSGLFLDYMVGYCSQGGNSGANYFGPSFRVGNKWYFGKSEKYRFGIQATWLRFGVYSSSFPFIDNIEYGFLAPMGLGFSNAFKLKDKHGMEVNLNGAPVIKEFDILLPGEFDNISSNDFGFLGSIDVKYRFGKLAVGLDYTYIDQGYLDEFHILSASFGLKF
ncbi:MAG: hypothetical protein A3D92_05530 [Bacteroidetes bacterium RIFCSPHIGHO2_02_FULL_44_7]|nr:MAG: hypothetical protein A3D92_05530 [Bacteroidetes bacterium RIFCSPHIGHO2_02_FULL_44_7]